jgi:hypothetical protein
MPWRFVLRITVYMHSFKTSVLGKGEHLASRYHRFIFEARLEEAGRAPESDKAFPLQGIDPSSSIP